MSFAREVGDVKALRKVEHATVMWADGPFYPPSMERLAEVIAAVRPMTAADLEPEAWCLSAGVFFEGVFDVGQLGDGYVPWCAIKMRAIRSVELWLVLPILAFGSEDEPCEFERLPALYTCGGSLVWLELEEAASALVEAFNQ